MTVAERPADRVFVGPHYNTLEQQDRAASFGMWVFLATELMLFGGLFAVYTIYRTIYPAGFTIGSHHLNLTLGATNTAVLIVSSVTMALAVRAAHLAQRRRVLVFLALTALLGTAFMIIKTVEYSQHFADGLVPGLQWRYDGPEPRAVQLFTLVYFALTSLHAIHLTVAILIVLITMALVWRNRLPVAHAGPIAVIGLYWHFVDIVWVFLLPLLYLFERQS